MQLLIPNYQEMNIHIYVSKLHSCELSLKKLFGIQVNSLCIQTTYGLSQPCNR